MDFTNEPYVRLFTRDTLTWKRLNWQAKATLPLLLRKLDRAGTMDLGGIDAAPAVALATELPLEVVLEAMPKLTELGVVEVHGESLVVPKFLEGQECIKSDKLRAKEYRTRKRSQAMADSSQKVTPASREITPRHETNETSRPVTLGLALPSGLTNSSPLSSGCEGVAFFNERRPVGDMPPWLPSEPHVPPRPSDASVVNDLYAEAVNKLPTALGRQDPLAPRDIALAVRAESGDDDKLFREVLRRILKEWKADKRAATHQLANLAKHIGLYTREKKAPPKPTFVPQAPPESEIDPLLRELFAEYKSQAVA